MAQFEFFAGIDWSTTLHQVAVIDASGEILGERGFAHSGEGLAAMADWILGHGPAGSAAAAIEKPHGPEVDALLERGGAVFALNPKQLDRLRRPLRAFRDRFFPAGAKDDRRDAIVLADSLATDRKAFREVETPPPEIIELRELSRSGSDLVAERTRLINRLKAHPGRCRPAFLKAAPDPGTDWALRLRELAPTPDKARRAQGLCRSRAQEEPGPARPRRGDPRPPPRQGGSDGAGNHRSRLRLRRTDRQEDQGLQRGAQGHPEPNRRSRRPDRIGGRRRDRRNHAVRSRNWPDRPGRHRLGSLRDPPQGRSPSLAMPLRRRPRHEAVRTDRPRPAAARRELPAGERRLPLGDGRGPARPRRQGEMPRAAKPRAQACPGLARRCGSPPPCPMRNAPDGRNLRPGTDIAGGAKMTESKP